MPSALTDIMKNDFVHYTCIRYLWTTAVAIVVGDSEVLNYASISH